MAGTRKRQCPHVLGIDDGPFVKGESHDVPLAGVMTAGADLVECVAITRFAIDGDAVTDFLGDWIRDCRFGPSLRAVVFGGVTIAGLGVIDIERLSARLRRPVIVVNRRDPRHHRMQRAFAAAGLLDRLDLVEATPAAVRVSSGLFASFAGIDARSGAALLKSVTAKSQLPEPLRLAHLIATAVVRGQSQGRA